MTQHLFYDDRVVCRVCEARAGEVPKRGRRAL